MIGRSLIRDKETRTMLHEVTDAVVLNVLDNGNDSKYLRGTTIDKNRAHVLSSKDRAVRIEYSIAGGAWQVVKYLGIDLAKEEAPAPDLVSGSSPVEDIHSDQPVEELTPCEQEGVEAHGCPAPKEDPLDVLYPVDNKLDLPF